jgi:hypothetical protein
MFALDKKILFKSGRILGLLDEGKTEIRRKITALCFPSRVVRNSGPRGVIAVCAIKEICGQISIYLCVFYVCVGVSKERLCVIHQLTT